MRLSSAKEWILSRSILAHLFERTDQRWLSLKDKYLGERCFILGNGPSLKQQDLSLLANEHVFVTNWFTLHDVFSSMKYANLCMTDPHLWNYGEGFYDQWLESLQRNPQARIFLEKSSMPCVKAKQDMFAEKPHFLTIDRQRKVWEGQFETDPTQGFSWGFTVIIDACLPLAFHMGFEKVYLMGCDCDYKLDEGNDFKNSFFYDVDKIPSTDMEHLKRQRELHKAQEQLHRWIPSYEAIKIYFESHSRQIYNAGLGGKLEVFCREDYPSLF